MIMLCTIDAQSTDTCIPNVNPQNPSTKCQDARCPPFLASNDLPGVCIIQKAHPILSSSFNPIENEWTSSQG